jgi:hypothetical protein
MSSLGVYRLGDCNKKWLRFIQGINQLQVSGISKIEVKMQYHMAI